MYRHFLFALMIIASISWTSCSSDEPAPLSDEDVVEQTTTLAGIDYSPAFSTSFQNLLKAYYAMKDAFVKADTSGVRINSVLFLDQVKVFSMEEVAAIDSLAYQTTINIPAELQKSVGELLQTSDIEKQRSSFETISQAMYKLIQTLKPSGIRAYNQYCPMAFNDKGAYWLSEADTIMNPYFGKKMLHCGEVKEVLIYQ